MSAADRMSEQFASIARELGTLREHERLMKTVRSLNLGPQEELRNMIRATAGVTDSFRRQLESSALQKTFADMQRQRELFESRFTLPEQTAKLFAEHERALAPFRHSIEQMRHPWFDIENQAGSIRALAQLQDLASSFASQLRPFSADLTEKLRGSLGDWTVPFELPQNLIDPVVRVGLYDRLGFDSTLTAFPRATFSEALSTSGVAPIPLVTEEDVDADTDDEESAQEAFAIIRRLERALRAFIASKLEELEGPKWYRRRIPPNLRAEWEDKKQRAVKAGEPPETPLIEYADFTDYVDIIVKRDNWKDVFSAHFDRPESVRESLVRLSPVRIVAMHSRLLTQEDELYLLAETTRLFRAID